MYMYLYSGYFLLFVWDTVAKFREQYLRIFNYLANKNSIFPILKSWLSFLSDISDAVIRYSINTTNYYVIVKWVQNKSKDMND